jgi:hypothetical protein
MVCVGSWRAKDGVQAFTITGTKEECYKIVEEAREAGGEFADTPNICHVHRGQWHVLLKLKVPVGVGSNNNSS